MNELTDNETAAEIGRFIDIWVRALTAIAGRTPAEARRWCEPFVRDCLELTLHQPAAYWVAPALVPAEFIATLAPDAVGRLEGDIQFAIDQGDDFSDLRSDEELSQARQRVFAVLEKYRADLPSGAISDRFQSDVPRSEALELAVRVVARQMRPATLSDPVRGRKFVSHDRISYGNAARLLVQGPDADAHLWWDAFGLNMVVVASKREKGAALFQAVRLALKTNHCRGDAPIKVVKAAA